MMRTRPIATVLLTLCACAHAVAQDKIKDPVQALDDACMDKAMTTLAMVDCAKQSYARWDKELNRAYADVRGKLDKAGQQALKESQQKWLAYRDAELKTIQTIYGAMQGTMYRPAAATAGADVIKLRAQELRGYADLFKPQDQD